MIFDDRSIGIFGSGQLGRMLAIEARKMGFRVACFSPDRDTPTGQIADVEIASPYEDLERVTEFAESVDVVTFEFENIPARTIEKAAKYTTVHPNGEILYITQNRLREKTFLFGNGFPVTPFYKVNTLEELEAAKARGAKIYGEVAGYGTTADAYRNFCPDYRA